MAAAEQVVSRRAIGTGKKCVCHAGCAWPPLDSLFLADRLVFCHQRSAQSRLPERARRSPIWTPTNEHTTTLQAEVAPAPLAEVADKVEQRPRVGKRAREAWTRNARRSATV